MKDNKKVSPLVEELTGVIPQKDIKIFIDGIENPAEPNQALKDAAERLKGKELFKESNDRARQILSEIKSLPIQETTLEEAAKNHAKIFQFPFDCDPEETFIEGAKWLKDISYSEEEVIAFGEFIFKNTLLAHSKGVKNLFEQFKKK